MNGQNKNQHDEPSGGRVGDSGDLLTDSSRQDLERWWCHMNCFHWPDDLPVPKPEGWDDLDDLAKMKDPTAKAVWDRLGVVTTLTGCLAYWNSENFRQGRVLCSARYPDGSCPECGWRLFWVGNLFQYCEYCNFSKTADSDEERGAGPGNVKPTGGEN